VSWQIFNKLKNIFTILFFIHFAGCLEKNSLRKFQKLLYTSHCQIFDIDGNVVRRYPFQYCSFDQDGSYVASHNNSIFFYNKKNELMREYKKFYPHHDILRTKLNDIYVFGSEYHLINKVYVREDVINHFSSAGKLLGQMKLSTMQEVFKKYRKPLFENNWIQNIKEKSYEYSHANSIHEFINNDQKFGVSLVKGDLLVNVGGLGVLLFIDKNLSHLKYIMPYEYGIIHDVYPLSNGNFLFFLNRHQFTVQKSYIVIKDHEFKNDLYKFNPDVNKFYSESVGSAELIDADHLLISLNDHGLRSYAKILNIKNGKCIEIAEKFLKAYDRPVQSIRLFDSENFLKNNLGF
jgi:hypothetical protein